MPETRKVQLFKNGASQAVRLPAEFRFPGDHPWLAPNSFAAEKDFRLLTGCRRMFPSL
jgi:hypothetical protein